MKLREKTTATLLIAIFMISIFAVAVPVFAQPDMVWVDDDGPVDPTHFLTIQEGIDAVADYGTVHVFAGTYAENLVIDKSLTVKSIDGAEVTIIHAQPTDFGVLIIGETTSATFDGFTVENYMRVGILAGAFSREDDPVEVHILNNIISEPMTQQNNNNIQIGDGTTGTVIGNEVFGAFLTSPDWSGSGILVAGSSNVVVSDNYVHNCEGGIQILGYEYKDAPAVDNLIESNLVENCDTGISVQANSIGTIIRFNDVLNNDIGIGSLAYDYPWQQDTPSGTEVYLNNIVGNENYGVKSSVWFYQGTGNVLAEEVDATLNWWGDATGPYHTTNPGGLGDDVSDNIDYSPWLGATFETTPRTYHVNPTGTIQDAVDVAVDDDTVFVHAGTYPESVSVVGFTSLTVKAEGAGKPNKMVTVNPNPSGFTNGFTVYSDGVIIEGFEICDTNFGIWFEGSYNKFSNNYIHDIAHTSSWDDGGVGISLWDLNGGSDYNEITKNRIEDIQRTGILLDVAWTAYIITGNTIAHNEISRTPWGSIEVLNAEYTTIHHNILSDCGDFGIALLAVYGIESNYNVIHHNEVTGGTSGYFPNIMVYPFYGGVASYNKIHHNTADTYTDWGTDNRDFKNSWN